MFYNMSEVLKNKETERFKLESFEITRDNFGARIQGIPIGKYIRLIDKTKYFNNIIMSDTPMEHRTNYEIITKAHGDILIAGLGIGMILLPLINKEKVKSITVVEKYQDIINMIGTQMPKNNKLRIIQGDIFENNFPRGTKFDIIYFDIWNYINSDVYEEMKELKRKYNRCLKSKKDNPNSWIGCWCEHEARYNKRI